MTPAGLPDNQPQAFGTQLRRLRESADVSLAQIAAQTKISTRILTSLEEGKFQFLPAPVFTRNFVAQYAEAVGTDPDQLVAEFQSAWDTYAASSGPIPVVEDEPDPQPGIAWRFWIPIILAGLILLAAAVAVWQMRTRRGMPGGPLQPTAPAVASPLPSPPPTYPPTVMPAPEGQLAIRLRVAGDTECWVRFRDGEGRTDQRLVAGGEEITLELPEPVLLTLGNAGAVTLRVDGTVHADLGQRGEVVHVEVTSTEVRRVRPRQTGLD